MNPVNKAIAENRIIFFPNGRYKYTPSAQALKKIEEAKKSFNSEKAIKAHSKKIIFRNTIKEASRKIILIENELAKGKQIIRIHNKEYICK